MITELEPGEIFVFGSNLAGRHGRGAALYAKRHFQAKNGAGEGPTGRCYAIPTKDEKLKVRTLGQINRSVQTFLDYASKRPNEIFLVTEIGCGLAGYSPKQIGPMFASHTPNVILPKAFKH